MAAGCVEDMALAKWCRDNGCLDVADQAWLSVLAVPGKMVMRNSKVQDGRTFLAGRTYMGSCLQGLPLKQIRMSGIVFWALEPVEEIHWLPVVSWRDWMCRTCSWVSPLGVKRQTKRWCCEHALLLQNTSEEKNLLETSAMNAFWQIPKSGLLSIAKAISARVEADKPLPEVMLALAEAVLGDLGDAEKLRLLRLRMPAKSDLLHLLDEHSTEDILETEDAKELKKMQCEQQSMEQEFGAKVKEMATRVRTQGPASSSSSTSRHNRQPSTNTSQRTKKARRYPPEVRIDESTTVQDLNTMLPSGCKFGYDGIDHCWRLAAYGTRYGRSVQLHGRIAGARQLVVLAWQRAVQEGWESECPFPGLLS